MKKYSNKRGESERSGLTIVQGNYYDKYTSANPLARLLMDGFISTVRRIVAEIDPHCVLDAGAGEGHMTSLFRQWLPERSTLVAVDVSGPVLRQAVGRVSSLEPVQADIQALPFRDRRFDLVIALEALEHLPAPHSGMAELARLSRKHVLVSVPREPLWRVLNIARGAYWSDCGNTPGHLRHWSRSEFVKFVTRFGTPLIIKSPLPWTIVLLEVREPIGQGSSGSNHRDETTSPM